MPGRALRDPAAREEWAGILFDLDGTLVDRDAAHAAWVADLVERRRAELADPEATRAALLAADEGGRRSRRDYFAWLAAELPQLGLGPRPPRAYPRELAARVEPRPEVTALLERLAARLPLGLVSNGAPPVQRLKLERAGLTSFFPRPVFSGDLRQRKPHPRLFAAGLASLGGEIPPARVLFVGDDPERDIAGARAAGLRTCWVSGGRPWPAELEPPEQVVADVIELSLEE